jgi:hypothetical protein
MKAAKPHAFAALLLLFVFSAQAQTGIIKGYLRDSITHYPIPNGTIINQQTQKKATTNDKGFFFLEATSGNRLYIQAPDYDFDTLDYAPFFADTLTLYLSPSGSILPGVTVRASYTKYQLDSMQRREDFDAIRGNISKTINDPPTTGVGVNIGLDKAWSKKEKQKVKAEKQFQKTEEQRYVDYRFSPQMVSYYTGLKADALRDYMHRYTPSYDWLRKHTAQQDVLLYINDKLKLFKKGSNNKS